MKKYPALIFLVFSIFFFTAHSQSYIGKNISINESALCALLKCNFKKTLTFTKGTVYIYAIDIFGKQKPSSDSSSAYLFIFKDKQKIVRDMSIQFITQDTDASYFITFERLAKDISARKVEILNKEPNPDKYRMPSLKGGKSRVLLPEAYNILSDAIGLSLVEDESVEVSSLALDSKTHLEFMIVHTKNAGMIVLRLVDNDYLNTSPLQLYDDPWSRALPDKADQSKNDPIQIMSLPGEFLRFTMGRIAKTIDMRHKISNSCGGELYSGIKDKPIPNLVGSVRVIDEIKFNGLWYITLSISDVGNCQYRGFNGMCGAGGNHDLIWLKFDKSLKLLKTQMVTITSCFRSIEQFSPGFSYDGSQKLEMNQGRLEITFGPESGKADSKVVYSHRAPNLGLLVSRL
jgi:hypothetical protein